VSTTRALLLGGTLAFVALMLVCALTPIAWYASGRPSESYPELFYIAYGWPAALALTLVAAIHWRKAGSTNVIAEALVWMGTLVIVWLCVLLSLITLMMALRIEASDSGILSGVAALSFTNFYALLIAGMVCVACGAGTRALLTKLNA
jgi:hypothetical protein